MRSPYIPAHRDGSPYLTKQTPAKEAYPFRSALPKASNTQRRNGWSSEGLVSAPLTPAKEDYPFWSALPQSLKQPAEERVSLRRPSLSSRPRQADSSQGVGARALRWRFRHGNLWTQALDRHIGRWIERVKAAAPGRSRERTALLNL